MGCAPRRGSNAVHSLRSELNVSLSFFFANFLNVSYGNGLLGKLVHDGGPPTKVTDCPPLRFSVVTVSAFIQRVSISEQGSVSIGFCGWHVCLTHQPDFERFSKKVNEAPFKSRDLEGTSHPTNVKTARWTQIEHCEVYLLQKEMKNRV